jgi:hypothetical protein
MSALTLMKFKLAHKKYLEHMICDYIQLGIGPCIGGDYCIFCGDLLRRLSTSIVADDFSRKVLR